MKRLILMALSVLLLLSSCGRPAAVYVLAERLALASASGKIMYGHQDDLMYGHTWNSSDNTDPGFTRSDIEMVCGQYPAILGLDLGGIELGNAENLDGNNFDAMRAAAQAHVERGGIVTLSWHMRNPLTGGDTWDTSSTETVASILEGGENHEKFLVWMDRMAEYVKSLGIPVIFRPFHEHSMNFFWWGSSCCTADEYNALWKMAYQYIVEEKGLADMLWAISPNACPDFMDWPQRYPGDDYVDLIGLDFYYFDDAFVENMKACLEFQKCFAEDHGKLLALTETGYEGIPDPTWWTRTLLPAVQDYPIAFLLTWRNASDRPTHFYGPYPGAACEADFVEFCKSDKTLFINDIR